ncbi:MAG: hypothetical protein HYY17_00510 [Planctomycetes bacterium]|nr:hypothetical protein [Planctomycetota bacterium]
MTEGRIAGTDFVPSPLAHPHCMSVCAVIRLDDGGFLPFVRCASREAVFELLKGRLGPDPDEPLARFLREAAPSASRRAAGAIVLHASMDAEHFDVSRSMRCPVAVLGPDGAAIPACSWGVLHREAGR